MTSTPTSINDLPDEVIEFILGYLPPYNNLVECMLVSKRWSQIVKNVMRHTTLNFHKGLSEFRLCWKSMAPAEMSPTIAGRFSHSTAVHGHSMYVFGGGSSSDTTFNDLWRFDLSRRQWIRPLSVGTYPSPKACASMVCHENTLILFGGWRHPSPHPPYQTWRLFEELHVYSIANNRWTAHAALGVWPPSMAGHSASVCGNEMIVFGGYQSNNDTNRNSNDLWCLNLRTFVWRRQETFLPKPQPRYGQFQIPLDDKHLLVLGGCGGANSMYSDAWLLRMVGATWEWRVVTIKNKKWAATHMWCNPACKVGTKLVVLGPTPTQPSDFQMVKQQIVAPQRIGGGGIPLALPNPQPAVRPRNQILEDANRRLRNAEANRSISNNVATDRQDAAGAARLKAVSIARDEAAIRLQRNLLLRGRDNNPYMPQRFGDDVPFENRLPMAAFNVQPNPWQSGAARERHFERLRRMEEKIHAMRREFEQKSEDTPSPKRIKRSSAAIFICDISELLAKVPSLEWMETKNYGIVAGAPDRLILSSIVTGNGELILFGGIQKETLSNPSSVQVSNALHFLTVPRGII